MKKIFLLLLLNITFIFISLSVGAAHISISDLWSSLFNPHSSDSFFILTELRFPRTMALVSIGLALGFSGTLLQTLLDNPLSEPYTLGLSGGATLGAVLALMFGIKPIWLTLPMGAVLGCVLATLLVLYFLKNKILWKANSIILIGVMISLFCGSFVTLIISLLEPTQVQLAVYWMMGQVGSEKDLWWPALFVIFVFSLFLGLRHHVDLDRILLGEDTAINLGTNVSSVRLLFILIVCLLTSLAVSIAGLVGFVGLVAPHVSYHILGTRRHYKTLLASPLVGSLLFLSADILARTFSYDIEIPSGSLMALLGAPILIYYLVRGLKNAHV